jgi:hypothetical protein
MYLTQATPAPFLPQDLAAAIRESTVTQQNNKASEQHRFEKAVK